MTRFLPVESGLLSPSSDFFIHTMGYSFPFSTLHTRLTVLPAQHRGRGSWSLQTVEGLLTQVRDHLGPGDELDGGPLRLGLGGQQGRGQQEECGAAHPSSSYYSLKRRSIRRFVITEKAPTRAFS